MTLTAYTAGLLGALLLPAGMFALAGTAGCATTTSGRAAETTAVGIATKACDALLPLATGLLSGPVAAVLGPLDVLACESGGKALADAINAEGPPPVAPVGQSAVYAHRPVVVGGTTAYVRGPAAWVDRVQARVNAQTVRAQ